MRRLLAVVPDAGNFVLSDASERLLPLVTTFLAEPESGIPFQTTLTGYHPGETG